MRLSTAPDRDEERAMAVLHAALDEGATLLDTANAYCHDDTERGHNERLLRRALASWDGDAASVWVATKGGLTRPDGRWEPDGRAKHLRAACEESLEALGADQLDLYQLHAVDPRTKLETSVRALARLQRDGLVRRVGLCNVNLEQLKRAREHAEIFSVQIELSPFQFASVHSGLVEYCRDEGILILAYRPLGGVTRARKLDDPESILAWLRSLSGNLAVLPGPTRVETARSSVRAQHIALDSATRDGLDARYPAASILRTKRAERRPPDDAPGDVVLIIGYPGAGKSRRAQALQADGYVRLNRDERGRGLRDLLVPLREHLQADERRVVLDNTYVNRAVRNEVIETAWREGVPVRCEWIDVSLEDAQCNAIRRMIDRYGKLLGPDELRIHARDKPPALAPRALFEFRRQFEPPALDEGFTRVDRIELEREPLDHDQRAVILNVDVLKGEAWIERLNALRADGTLRLGVAWSDGELDLPDDWLDDVAQCTHVAGPVRCWCRKPIPGLAIWLIHRHRLDPAQCTYVGRSALDRTLADRAGLTFSTARSFLDS